MDYKDSDNEEDEPMLEEPSIKPREISQD